MGNRTGKKLCIALIYLIPVIIFINTLSKMYKVFWNVNDACQIIILPYLIGRRFLSWDYSR